MPMRAGLAGFAARRILSAALTVISALLLLFLLIKFVPGDLTSILLGPRSTPVLRQTFTERMVLYRSIFEQLWLFIAHALIGDFGQDVISFRPILTIVTDVLPYTLSLAFAAMGLSLAIGIPLGILAALKPGSIVDSVLSL